MNASLHFLLLFTLIINTSSLLLAESSRDSAQQVSSKKWSFKSTARVHSKGMFAYGGRIASKNAAFDINFMYSKKQWGFLAFKAFDLGDRTSPNNFTLAVFFRNFNISPRITITPYVGAFLEQQHHMAGHGSDVAIINVTTFKINSKFSVDHTLLLANMVVESALSDCVNRMRLLYSHKHMDVITTVWHNNQLFDQADYTSSSVQIAYSRIRLSDSLAMSVAFTELSMWQSSNEQAVAKDHQCLLSVALQLVR